MDDLLKQIEIEILEELDLELTNLINNKEDIKAETINEAMSIVALVFVKYKEKI